MKKIQLQQGFTLIETLVAISILVVAVTGAYGAATAGISSGIFSKDQTVAFYLAQEGVEQIRNMRDGNGLSSQPWLTSISASQSDPCYFGNTCTVDAFNNAISRCPDGAGSCPLLQEDPVNGFYGYNAGWTNTIYDREITLTSINDHEVAIGVVVKWSKGGVNENFTVRENIFDWQ
jgi:prepilin-type N-terminal cleavage/methylation domain-containing protein